MKTTIIVPSTTPANSSAERGHVHLISLPCAPWQQPVTMSEAIAQAHEMGGIIRHTAGKRHEP